MSKAVENLSALWLVETTTGNERLLLRGLTRELTRAQMLKDSRAEEFRQRYVAYFLRQAVKNSQPVPDNLDVMDVEKDNILGALDSAFKKKDWRSVIEIRKSLNSFLHVRGHWDDAIGSAKLAETAAREVIDEYEVAYFTTVTAIIHRGRGENEEAERIYQESLEFYRRIEHEENVSRCLHQLGVIALEQGHLEKARGFYIESMTLKKKLGDQGGVARTLNELGRLAQTQDDFKEARRHYSESLEINRVFGDRRVFAITLHLLATLAVSEGNLVEARRLYNESLEITERLGDKSNLAQIYFNLGLLENEEGNETEAARWFHEALLIAERLSLPIAERARVELRRVGEN